jgi:hypothetical protein
MSAVAGKLRLGPLPKTETVKVTIMLNTELKDELDFYAAEFSKLHAPVDSTVLIPHMLDMFIRSDRGYRARRRALSKSSPHKTAIC